MRGPAAGSGHVAPLALTDVRVDRRRHRRPIGADADLPAADLGAERFGDAHLRRVRRGQIDRSERSVERNGLAATMRGREPRDQRRIVDGHGPTIPDAPGVGAARGRLPSFRHNSSPPRPN